MNAMFAIVCLAIGECVTCGEGLTELTAEDVVQRMVEMDRERATSLRAYMSDRLYVADNRKFSKHAEVGVEEWFASPDRKVLRVVSEAGSPEVRRRVIDKVIEAELESVRAGNREQTHMTEGNYRFRLAGTEMVDGHSCYVLDVSPKREKKYLMVGRIWVDETDFAIVRIEGRPAKSPSFWTRDVHFVRSYQKHGPFWLPASFKSESRILIVGTSTLQIKYSNYRIESNAHLVSKTGAP
jgi:hypothetical protein